MSAAPSKDQSQQGETTTTSASPSKPSQQDSSKMSPSSQKAAGTFKLLLLGLMVAQNSSVVLLGRYVRSGKPQEDMFNINHFVLTAELAKFVMSCMLEFHATQGGLFHSIHTNILANPLDALKISVPALLYLIQNTLLYVALSNLSAPLFQVTYQAKLVTTAVVSVILLNRNYVFKQWICLVALSIGVATVVLGEKKDTGEKDAGEQSLMTGLIAVTIACFSSAFAGVYFERVLKKATTNPDGTPKQPVSMWMRNIQLAFFSVMIAVGKDMFRFNGDADADATPKDFFHGFDAMAWILVLLQAGGGLLVAAVIKYADNVLKGLATGVSVVVATMLSMPLFGTQPSVQFAVGAIVILTSVFFFSNDLPTSCQTKQKVDDASSREKVPMLPK
uniref:CMP-sialic acid transporter n=1 Tax=Grammatophora oceanica TaxID=210454 RepID=A0A6U5IBB9_9STRA|mmetsp:Transcript_20838/g.30889  ORF Transcript_20838/g.30889 Transcript_20838/m.30889 type:complete len:390 (+) Transcript_20838:254-1423(+)